MKCVYEVRRSYYGDCWTFTFAEKASAEKFIKKDSEKIIKAFEENGYECKSFNSGYLTFKKDIAKTTDGVQLAANEYLKYSIELKEVMDAKSKNESNNS